LYQQSLRRAFHPAPPRPVTPEVVGSSLIVLASDPVIRPRKSLPYYRLYCPNGRKRPMMEPAISNRCSEQPPIQRRLPRPGGDMSSVTTPPSVVPSPSPDVPPRSIPSLDELYEWTSEPDHRVVIRGVDWAFYEQLVDSIPEGANIHVDYDGKDLEIMSLSQLHDGIKKRLGRFVELTAEELEIPCTGLGQATWKRPEVTRGLESDECYYFAPEKLVVAAEAMMRMSMDGAAYPNPDLAIEVDLSPSKIDRPGIYAALRVAEVWRFDGEHQLIIIEQLGDDGSHQPVEGSTFLPVRAEEVGRWVLKEDFRDGSLWGRRLRAWVRAELAPRLPR